MGRDPPDASVDATIAQIGADVRRGTFAGVVRYRRPSLKLEASTMAPTERDTDTYARDSFTWRGMAKWQVWSISIAAAVIVVLLLAYVM
jgi:hypothetical protein